MIFYVIFTVVLTLIGYFVAYAIAYANTNKENIISVSKVGGGIIGFVLAIFISASVYYWVEDNAKIVTTETKVTVVGACIEQVQTTKISSSPYVVWTDDKGVTHQTDCSDCILIDSDEWVYVKLDHEVKNYFMDLLYEKDDEIFFYVPMDVLYPNMAQ